MQLEDQIRAALERLQAPNATEPDRKAAQSFLLAFQRSPESWHCLTHWVTTQSSSSMILQLYALQSLQAKINRDWDELEAMDDAASLVSGASALDGKERLRDWFLGLFGQLASGQAAFSEGIRHKFIQTVLHPSIIYINPCLVGHFDDQVLPQTASRSLWTHLRGPILMFSAGTEAVLGAAEGAAG
jgi:hypothetical protein